MISVSLPLVIGAVAAVYAVALVFVVALCRAAAPPWWERTAEEISDLPEADPEDPRGRPSQDGRT
jgi:uncharacterized protein YjeT (DUF2065 family)